MADAFEEFAWLGEFGPFYDVSCVSFARSLTPPEALARLEAGVTDIEEVTFEGFQERTMWCVDSDNMRSTYVGAIETAGWTVLIQLWAGSIGLDNRLMRSLSRESEVVVVHRNLHASDYFIYAVDGEQITWFDQLRPHARTGIDPDRLVEEMREVGLDPDHDWEGPGIDATFPRSFALAKRITGFPFSKAMLAPRFLAAVIRNG
ncbi:DUF6461 domain-containing protein [Nonomuraea jiangxiensis]|uniref:Uncharacterized protein n=1 Tax=Nonomuraea jiangxiensis TaxID=633440 RepID=A0A1G8XRI5_9ACTN|nr:DUF6461 domain-containing protein [Nonomuraea jiangxiensis]SDJ93169.1 hypothetical protein SAMN05421869_11354 [Nonomuraea jiangxiensis]